MRWVSLGMDFKKQERACWHLWFAWRPVRVGQCEDGATYITWMEYVLRRGTYEYDWEGDGSWSYVYKAK